MKKLIVIVMVLSLIILSVACNSGAADSSQTSGGESGETNTPVTGTGTGSAQGSDYDIMGEIIEIVGNEVTLKLMEFNADEAETRVPGSGMGRNGGGVPSEKNYTGEELTLIIPVGTQMVTRVPGQSTGTTAESGSGTGTGPVENEIGLNELAKGMFLKIRYFDDNVTIEKILVQKPRT